MRYFRLRRDTEWLKKGAIFKSYPADITRYQILDTQYFKFSDTSVNGCYRSRNAVENQPEWFEEVFPTMPLYATKDEIKQMKLRKAK